MKTKRILAALVAALFLITLAPVGAMQVALASDDERFYQYELTDGEATITGYTGTNTVLTIPSTLGGYPVVAIDNYFEITHKNSITQVTIPDSVLSIGNAAFYGFSSLESVTLPAGLTAISGSLFYGCIALTTLELPASVTSIGSSAFYNCSSLKELTLPASLSSIGEYAFSNCSSLASYSIDSSNENFSCVDGVLFNKQQTLLVMYPAGKTDTSYTIPEGVTSIQGCAFYGCKYLTAVDLPVSMTTLSRSAFEGFHSLKSYTVPAWITSIENRAFTACDSLTSVTIGSGVTSIGMRVFADCSSLSAITIPATVTSIGDDVFMNDPSLQSILVDSGSANFTSVDGVLFSKDMTTLLAYPNGKAAVSYTVPSGVTTLGYDSFAYSNTLVSVNIADSVTTLAQGVFYYCSALKNVYFRGEAPAECPPFVFYGCGANLTVYYPNTLAASWEPNGETKWHNLPILPYTEAPYFKLTDPNGVRVRQYVKIDTEAGQIGNLPPATTTADLEEVMHAELTSATGALKTGDTVTYNGAAYRVVVMGDVDKNGKVTSADAAMLLRATVRLTVLDELQTAAASIFSHGSFDTTDAAKILRYIVKLEYTLGETE